MKKMGQRLGSGKQAQITTGDHDPCRADEALNPQAQ
jgi:hypothetical protein